MRRLLLLASLLLLPASVSAQFTIPNDTNGGLAGSNQSLWMQADIDAVAAGIAGQGVVSGCAVTAQGSPNMSVAVAAGSVKIAGVAVSVAGGTVSISAATSQPRIDLVTVDASATLSAVAGTAAANPEAPALPSGRVLLAMVYVPASDTDIDANQIVDKRVILPPAVAPSTGAGEPFAVSVLDYGAVCDGVADDAAAFQAAVDAVAAAGNGGVVLFPAATCNFASTVIIGDTSGGTATEFISLKGAGPDATKLRWAGSTAGTALHLKRNKFFKMEGFTLTNIVGRGTSVGFALDGFSSGTETLGGIFERLIVSGWNRGFDDGPTSATSEVLYNQVALYGNDYGWYGEDFNTLDHQFHMLSMDSNGVGLFAFNVNVTVDGGSASGSVTSDFYFVDCVCAVNHWRSETANRTVIAHGNNLHLSMLSTLAHVSSNADGVLVDLGENVSFGRASIIASRFEGKIQITGYGGNVDVSSTTSKSGSSFDYNSVPFELSSGFQGLTGSFTSIGNGYYGGISYLDRAGNFGGQANEFQSTLTPAWVMNVWGDRGNVAKNASLRLHRVSMLAEGSNTEGVNLRVQVKFATSATAAFTFTRTIQANNTGSNVWLVTSGTIFTSDEGKYATFSSPGTGLIYGVDTAAQTFHLTTDCGPCTPATITVGRNEPDANYMLMFACDKQETISWSAKATTGFTLTSSNASSVATCDVLIVR